MNELKKTILRYFISIDSIFFCRFLAYTLDGIDGKQARRIGLAGPLGELFDHGLDSYTAPLIPACLYSIFGNGPSSIPPMRMYFIVWMVLFNFFISHFEKYNTGVLYLPWGYDFGMWVGIEMWQTSSRSNIILSIDIKFVSFFKFEGINTPLFNHMVWYIRILEAIVAIRHTIGIGT